jgi:hypothetical protein
MGWVNAVSIAVVGASLLRLLLWRPHRPRTGRRGEGRG